MRTFDEHELALVSQHGNDGTRKLMVMWGDKNVVHASPTSTAPAEPVPSQPKQPQPMQPRGGMSTYEHRSSRVPLTRADIAALREIGRVDRGFMPQLSDHKVNSQLGAHPLVALAERRAVSKQEAARREAGRGHWTKPSEREAAALERKLRSYLKR